MNIDMESVGNRIKQRRKELQLTQTDIFNLCGIRSGSLSRIENGTSIPSVTLFYKISEILKCDMNWLLTGVSSNMKIPSFSKYEESLFSGFRELSVDDQEEILAIMELKLRKAKRDSQKMVKLSNSDQEDIGSSVG